MSRSEDSGKTTSIKEVLQLDPWFGRARNHPKKHIQEESEITTNDHQKLAPVLEDPCKIRG